LLGARLETEERKMTFETEKIGTTVVEELFGEFNETLRTTGQPDFTLLERCPEAYRKELRSLMNVATLTYHALEPERQALHGNTVEKRAS
jgi:hypothetical protein